MEEKEVRNVIKQANDLWFIFFFASIVSGILLIIGERLAYLVFLVLFGLLAMSSINLSSDFHNYYGQLRLYKAIKEVKK